MHRRAFTLVDLLAVAALGGLAAAVLCAAAPDPKVRKTLGLARLKAIAEANGKYRNDNNAYLPITLTYTPRGTDKQPWNSMAGWCTWSHLGKNNDKWWATEYAGGIFDVEAADRPLNPYLFPRQTFCAPPPPQKLPPDDPCRQQQGEAARDPGDNGTYQRKWPNQSPEITGYDDVGTSYHWNGYWWSQPEFVKYPTFESRMAAGTAKLAAEEDLDPWRFIWNGDQLVGVVPDLPAESKKINGYGDINYSMVNFMDGHAGYQEIFPGKLFNNGAYQLQFQFD